MRYISVLFIVISFIFFFFFLCSVALYRREMASQYFNVCAQNDWFALKLFLLGDWLLVFCSLSSVYLNTNVPNI